MSKSTVYTRLAKLERKLTANDSTGILIRWEYGRELLKAKAGRAQLPAGMIDDLVAAGERDGQPISRREIQYRAKFATVYVSEAQVRKIICTLGSWSEIINAGFPEVAVDEVLSPEAILDAIESQPRELLEFEQIGMFPEIVKTIPLAESTLRHLIAYAEEMAAMTASYARRDIERREHLNALSAAVSGDLDATYPEAVSALRARELAEVSA